MPRIVDPRFPILLRTLRQQRGLTLRALAPLVLSSRSHLADFEHGRKRPTRETAERLDEVLGADGALAAMVREELPFGSGEADRLQYAARSGRVDAATVESLAAVLAHQRRLEDAVGSSAMVAPVLAQLRLIEAMVNGARQDETWRPLIDTAGQWAHFAGWLCTTTGEHDQGRAWYQRGLEWATEAGNPHLLATILSMRGHLAWVRGQFPAMVGHSRAAAWQPASLGVRALAVQQEARGLALLEDARAAEDGLDRAEELAVRATDHPEAEPDWMYFYDPTFFQLQRGLAQHYLGRSDRAAELLSGGLDRLPAEVRQSDWIGWYVVQLASAHAASGEADVARSRIGEARSIADATGATRLSRDVAEVERALDD
ncbi:helix-turn-helix domain-containing protein [Plantactinospora sp. WMMC1484]|uniref:helix-turn-helix domain-containing protein n=1 Tax=Plantactinospora sp. WMMC1484 TaxID=3404122 RepID=UPI003BF4FEB3